MQVISNPTAKLSSSHIWGFEITHVLIAASSMLVSNMVLSLLGLPVIYAWALAAFVLITLRVLSHGRQSGHINFLLQRLMSPRIFLGSSANLKREVL